MYRVTSHILEDLKISFEIECFVSGRYDFQNLCYTLGKPDLASAGLTSTYSYLPELISSFYSHTVGMQGFYCAEEGSIDLAEDDTYDDFHSFELITPIVDSDISVDILSQVLATFNKIGLSTNSTCGLHVNISFDGIEEVTPFSLITNLDELAVLRDFDREENKFCKPYVESMKHMAENDFNKFVWSLDGDDQKNVSINFNKLKAGNPYLEFRMTGGDNYHEKITLLKRAISKYIVALEDAYCESF